MSVHLAPRCPMTNATALWLLTVLLAALLLLTIRGPSLLLGVNGRPRPEAGPAARAYRAGLPAWAAHTPRRAPAARRRRDQAGIGGHPETYRDTRRH
jgi:hypothetical protein